MKRWRASALLLAGAAALSLGALGGPAAGQQEKEPEQLLPPGFDDPGTVPPPEEQPPDPPGGLLTAPPPTGGAPPAEDVPLVEDAARQDLEDLAALELPPPIEIPDEARRPTDFVGPLGPDNWGLGAAAFGNAHGRFLTALMGRVDAPLPSRWASILLRRALLSQVPTPPLVPDVDWIAERAWLLLRMGEADAARALVQAVDVDRFTPRMFTVAVQTALATADPAGLCPLVEPGRAITDEPIWPVADAMCAALEGEAARASQLIDQARRRSGASGIDLLLAEKVIGAGLDTRRAVTIQWEGVDELNSWRFGLASATGLQIPPGLLQAAGPHVLAWQARAPMVPLEQRVAAAEAAAVIGVFSHAALVEIHSLLLDATDPSEAGESLGGRLRRAYAAPDSGDRLSALRGLWQDDAPGGRYGRLILTATASGRVPPAEERAAEAADGSPATTARGDR